MFINRMKKRLLMSATLTAVLMALVSTSALAQVTIDQVTAEGVKRADAGAAEQQRVEQIANQTDELLAESIDNVALIERQIVPMMTRMLDSLEEFIRLDTPFLMKERTERLARLREMMERSDVTAAEKFRRVIEAYQIENDYGRTIEAYKGSVDINGAPQEVDFLRIGRVSLTYQSVGGQYTGAWDQETRQWVELDPAEFKNQVADGIRVARKQIAPDLLVVPVAAPVEE